MPSKEYYVSSGRPKGRPRGSKNITKRDVKLTKLAGDQWQLVFNGLKLTVSEEQLITLREVLDTSRLGRQVDLTNTVDVIKEVLGEG